MRNLNIRLTFLGLAMLLLAACAKEKDPGNDDARVGGSRVVNFPSVQIKGERLIILDQGATYTDPGVTAKLKGQDVQATVTGTVNTATPGIYAINYSATSPDGYSASDWRTVVVISNSAQVTANDFSGTYERDNGVRVYWTKLARGVYEVDNPGGAGVGVGFKVILVNYDANRIRMPRQMAFDPSINGLNTISSNSEQYNPSTAPISVKYALTAGGYGTQVRNFIKL